VDERPTPDGARSIARSIAGVSVAAATKILEACRHGETPKLGRLPRADRVRQLALALDPKQLVIELFVTDPLPPAPGSLLAFGKGADWLAHNTGARVVLVVPQSYMRAGELDHLAYGLDERVNPEPSVANDNAKASSSVAPGIDRGAVGSAEVSPTVRVGAIAGRPHPNSDAEVLLHQKLIVDAELGELFAFNRLIKTKFGLNPRVDLIWEPGQLVIEVDGHPLHSKHGQFCHDRRRDYELMLSGYRVLRLPDAAIVSDPDKILEQIRNVVRYLRENKP
jgi:very-short-patch-repair endonuclease